MAREIILNVFSLLPLSYFDFSKAKLFSSLHYNIFLCFYTFVLVSFWNVLLHLLHWANFYGSFKNSLNITLSRKLFWTLRVGSPMVFWNISSTIIFSSFLMSLSSQECELTESPALSTVSGTWQTLSEGLPAEVSNYFVPCW